MRPMHNGLSRGSGCLWQIKSFISEAPKTGLKRAGKWVPAEDKEYKMAFVQNTTSEFGPVARLRAFVAQVAANWAMSREYKRTYAQLSRLTNRELADIGVRRCDIADIARKHVHQCH